MVVAGKFQVQYVVDAPLRVIEAWQWQVSYEYKELIKRASLKRFHERL